MFPPALAADFRIATADEIRSWSFGALTGCRPESSTFLDHVKGTLYDQAIFGPVHDFKCGCGKYDGKRHANMICDRCGVKVAPSTIRGTRFAHIEFPVAISHPFESTTEVRCFPVIPITLVQSTGGGPLANRYEQLVEAANHLAAGRMHMIVASIIEKLTEVAVQAQQWQLADATVLVRGLALEHQHANKDLLETCDQCGYPLVGLRVERCPGCGRRV